MRRRLLGIISALLLLAGALGLLFGGGSGNETGFGLLASSCIRAGSVLGALWLAFPQIADLASRFPPWLIGALALGGLAIAVRPRTASVLAPLLALLLVMHLFGFLLRPAKREPRSRKPVNSNREPRS